jgi:molybdopterin synthase sulfur carrier subunit
VATLRLFAQAREAAGTSSDEIDAPTVAAVIDVARERYGAAFDVLVGTCQIWLNGEPADGDQPVGARDEVAVLPPVSGG